MGRTLTNTMLNLGIQNACDEALYQVIISTCACSHFVYKITELLLVRCMLSASVCLFVTRQHCTKTAKHSTCKLRRSIGIQCRDSGFLMPNISTKF